MTAGQAAVTYSALFLGVSVGAVLPVIPTGVLVSAAAAAALYSDHPLAVVLVLAVAAMAALLGDVALFAICSSGGSRLVGWLRRRVDDEQLERTHQRLAGHRVGVLVLSRLTPGGRIPVMLASVLVGLSWRWFLAGDAVAVAAWSVTYAAIGIVGGSLFDEPWQGVALAVGLVLAIAVVPPVLRRLR